LVGRQAASINALSNVVKTFFSDSPLQAVNSLLDMSASDLSDEELERLNQLIQARKKQNKKKTGDEQ
ncbi:MAG: hypothetical protein RQ757_08275, partial [Pseudomonadales bacterium]|nr:hypothetical protein [Pseudomonadales bacterium]